MDFSNPQALYDMFSGIEMPAPRDLGQEMRSISQAMRELAPQVLEMERQYRPQYLDLELGLQRQALLGRNNIIDTYAQARDKEMGHSINRINTMSPGLVDAVQGQDVSPIQQMLEEQAINELGYGMDMTDGERRGVNEASRRAFAARGLERSMPAVADELLQEFNLGRILQDQRRAFAMDVDTRGQGQRNLTAGILMGNTPEAAGSAGALAGSAQPRMFDPSQNQYASQLYGQNYGGAWSGYNAQSNMLASLYGGQMQMDAAQMQADASRSAGRSGLFGSLASGALIGAGAWLGCWSAREAFDGAPEWLEFKRWMLEDAPPSFRAWYLDGGGEAAAEELARNPAAKVLVRELMSVIIAAARKEVV
jgi:hypothetical protein